MWMCRRVASSAAIALVAFVLSPARSHACGPWFPPELFFDRAATLANLPDGSFLVEAMRLLPAPQVRFVVVELAEEPAHAREGGDAEETALYQAGAAAWRRSRYAEAGRNFAAVLALPAEQRRHFSTFAAYMLGRNAGPPAEASRWYAQVRELARAGFADPLGLAVASFGAEARGYLLGGDDREAIRLYALQAAQGSTSGALSLLFVARQLVADPQRLERVLDDPLAQRLLCTYVWTRGQENWYAGDNERRPTTSRLLERLGRVPELAGADRLAAAAWRTGHFDLAARFADKVQTPLAWWVQSKLALRRGERGSAEQLLAQAIAGFLADAERAAKAESRFLGEPRGSARDLAARASGDAAVLALARGDFAGALRKAADSCSYADVAYLADQVLTTAELARLLEPGTGMPASCVVTVGDDFQQQPLRARLRHLLARRLLRSGQHPQALGAFEDPTDAELAARYSQALAQGRPGHDDIERAQALFAASRIARQHGLELLGTETQPDWAIVAGDYDLGSYTEARRYPAEADDAQQPFEHPLPAELRASLLTSAEAARVAANAPPHPQRFHYRETAADLAEAAARLVPPRSQAYYAILCTAARYVRSADPERMHRLWIDYVRHGALVVDDHSVFGETCPQPDFERARSMAVAARAWHWPKWRKRTYATVAAPILGLGMAITVLVLRRRRRRSPSTPESSPAND